MPNEKKLCVIFPGLGYHADKPLLYYSGKLARSAGYEIISIVYENMPAKVLGNEELMRKAYECGFASAEQQLKAIPLETYAEVLFIGKSIGTAIGSAYAEKYGLNVQGVWYTPIAETFAHAPKGIAFHGTNDPWVDTQTVVDGCEKFGIPLYVIRDANHSLETGDILSDLAELVKIMRRTNEFIR